eukprot:gene24599-30965_t
MPSVVPSILPSPAPSVSPTTAPSAAPSRSPTVAPSQPTLPPSMAPSAVNSGKYYFQFDATLTLYGLNLAEYQASPVNAMILQESIASTMTDVLPQEITNLRVSETYTAAPSRRRQLRMVDDAELRMLDSAPNSIVVLFTCAIHSADNDLTYVKITTSMTANMDNGNFLTALKASALAHNTTAFAVAAPVAVIVAGCDEGCNTISEHDKNLFLLGFGVLAVIVVGSFVLCVAGMVIYNHFYHPAPPQFPSQHEVDAIVERTASLERVRSNKIDKSKKSSKSKKEGETKDVETTPGGAQVVHLSYNSNKSTRSSGGSRKNKSKSLELNELSSRMPMGIIPENDIRNSQSSESVAIEVHGALVPTSVPAAESLEINLVDWSQPPLTNSRSNNNMNPTDLQQMESGLVRGNSFDSTALIGTLSRPTSHEQMNMSISTPSPAVSRPQSTSQRQSDQHTSPRPLSDLLFRPPSDERVPEPVVEPSRPPLQRSTTLAPGMPGVEYVRPSPAVQRPPPAPVFEPEPLAPLMHPQSMQSMPYMDHPTPQRGINRAQTQYIPSHYDGRPQYNENRERPPPSRQQSQHFDGRQFRREESRPQPHYRDERPRYEPPRHGHSTRSSSPYTSARNSANYSSHDMQDDYSPRDRGDRGRPHRSSDRRSRSPGLRRQNEYRPNERGGDPRDRERDPYSNSRPSGGPPLMRSNSRMRMPPSNNNNNNDSADYFYDN